MDFKLKVVSLAGIISITALAFAQNSALTGPAASVAVSQPVTAAALPAKPASKPAAKREKPRGFTWGYDLRIRSDVQNNTADFSDGVNDESRLLRYTPHISASADLGKSAHFNFRVGADFYKKFYQTCSNANAACGLAGNAGKSIGIPFNAQEIWVDNANLKFDSLPGLPNTSLQVGRFNLAKGDGFLLWSGVPGVGPKAGYYDGILITHKYGKHTIDLLATKNNSTDDFFPVIHKYFNGSTGVAAAKAPSLNNDMGDLGAIIGYYTNRQLKNTDIDAYYGFFKQDYMRPIGYNLSFKAADYIKGYSNLQWQPDRHWSAIGGRLVQRFPGHVIVHANYTGQIGTQAAMTTANNPYLPAAGYPEVAIRAYAWNASVNKYLKIKTRPFAGFGYSYYSGSDPKNPKVDGNYYPAFGEYATTQHPGPFMEEGYPVQGSVADVDGTSSQKELGVAPWYMANYISYHVRAGYTPWTHGKQELSFIGEFHYIDAPHPFMGNSAHYNQNPAANATAQQLLTPMTGYGSVQPFFNISTLGRLHRENEIGAEVNYKVNDDINFYCYWSRALYGGSNFYKGTWNVAPYAGAAAIPVKRADSSDFIRINLSYRFKSFIPYNKEPR